MIKTKMSYLHTVLSFSQLYAAIVRIVGYNGLTMRDRPEKMGPIGEMYGKGAARGALEELTREDDQNVLRLTDEARKLSRFILGPEPETRLPLLEPAIETKPEEPTPPDVVVEAPASTTKRRGEKRKKKTAEEATNGDPQ